MYHQNVSIYYENSNHISSKSTYRLLIRIKLKLIKIKFDKPQSATKVVCYRDAI